MSSCYSLSLDSKPPPERDNGRTRQQQERWEEMNRRGKLDREFENATPKTDHQMRRLKAEKSKEKHRRWKWDRDWRSGRMATASADGTDAALTALSAPKTNEEPTTPEPPDIRSSKSKRGLAKVQKLVTKPWTKASEASGLGGHKEGKQKNEKKNKTKKEEEGKEERKKERKKRRTRSGRNLLGNK